MDEYLSIEYLLPLALLVLVAMTFLAHNNDEPIEIEVPPLPELQKHTEAEDSEQSENLEMQEEAYTSPTFEQRRQYYAVKEAKEELEEEGREIEDMKQGMEQHAKEQELRKKEWEIQQEMDENELEMMQRENTLKERDANRAKKTLTDQVNLLKKQAEAEEMKRIWRMH
jgi:hypothetical protein